MKKLILFFLAVLSLVILGLATEAQSIASVDKFEDSLPESIFIVKDIK